MVVPGAFPHRGKIPCQRHQCLPIDRGTRRPFGVQPDKALLDLLDALERGVPPRLQLPRDMPLGGIDPARIGGPRVRLRIRPPQAPARRRADARPPPGRPARPPAAPPPQHVKRPRPGCARRPLGRCADRRCQCKDRGPPRLPGTGSGRDDPTGLGRTPASCVRSGPDRSTGPGRPGPICARHASSYGRSPAAFAGSPRNRSQVM